MMKTNIAFLLVFSLFETLRTEKIFGREKRHLVYPKPESKVQLIIGTGVPIPLQNHAITMGWVLKGKYTLPSNSSSYTDPYVTFQKRSAERKASRFDFYRMIESVTDVFGTGGKECMLKTICEASRIPFKASGLAGQLLKIILLPSTTDEIPHSASDVDYLNAENLGREKSVNCANHYPTCSFTLIDLLTVIV